MKRHHDERDGEHHHDRQRRAQRPVVGRTELGRDDLAEHDPPGTADHHRRDVVADRRNELDDGGDNDAGHRQRQRDPEERPHRAFPEIGRGFEQRAVDLRKRDVDRQDRERRPAVGKGQDHGKPAVEQELQRSLQESQLHQRGVDDAAVAQHDLPREYPEQVARPERQAQEDQPGDRVLADLERQEVRHRICQRHGDQGHRRGHANRAPEKLAVDPLVEERLVVLERERLVDMDVVLGVEAVDDEREDRQRQRADHDRERRRQLRIAAQPFVPEE